MTQRKSAAPRKRPMKSLAIPCRDGRSYGFTPERTALLVIDMQRDFFGEDGSAEVLAVIPRVSKLIAAAREVGCRVIHTREGYAPDLSDVTPFRKSLGYAGRRGPLGRFLIRGEAGHDFLAEARPAPGEAIIDKAGFSAFYKSGLDKLLRTAGVDHLILCGVTTQCCVHSTLREAVDHGYWCLTVADCCAAEDPELHEAALSLIAGEGHLFGWVCKLSDVLRAARGPLARLRSKLASSAKK